MYILGVFRRTALWGIILAILGAVAMQNIQWSYSVVYLGGAYIMFVLLHLIICIIQKSSRSSGEIFLSALGRDLIAPFSKIGMFIAVLLKKWVINDDSKLHNFTDGIQIVTGGIWSIAVFGIVIFFVLKMVL
ncbi:MAG: hypothetical protein IJV71_04765 [Lachnospiraceae bacterium]|nr:hypothetical protein [Lachnospiraceae bacterium]